MGTILLIIELCFSHSPSSDNLNAELNILLDYSAAPITVLMVFSLSLFCHKHTKTHS